MNTNTIKKYQIVPKEQDHGKWYQSVLTVADMIDYSDVGGCYVLKPLACQIWNLIKDELNKRITNDFGIQETCFPLFVTESALKKESSHFNDFTLEVAWINTSETHYDKLDQETLELINKLKSKGLNINVTPPGVERYAIRPTSETIIYPHFAEWIKKDGKYPKIHQWVNVVRWENKATQPFTRSKEFMWNEAHTTYGNKDDAIKEVYDVLTMYKELYERLLAVPMIDGNKTKSETFPGAELTTTIEAFLPDSGRGIQAATSHYLGQKFSQIFNIKDSKGEYVHQNSWGLTTRSIGIMVMTHSDDKGLVLPPAVAPIQVVIVACGITSKVSEEDKNTIYNKLRHLKDYLVTQGIRTVFDDEPSETPGMKFNKWEVKGIPLRLEFGPKDLQNNTILFVRRDKPPKTKEIISFDNMKFDNFIKDYLSKMQNDMLSKATERLKSNIVYCRSNKEIVAALQNKKLVLIDWDDSDDDGKLEESLKIMCKDNDINSTKILCIPERSTLEKYGFSLDKQVALFGRSY